MTDKHTLNLARQWAEWVHDNPEMYDRTSDRARAASDVVASLPDGWVSVDELRKYIADWREGLGAFGMQGHEDEMLDDLESLLAPPAPRTMAEIEWDDNEHHLAEATAAWTEGTTSEVVMLQKQGGKITVYQHEPHYTGLRELNPAILTPTGRKYRLEPAESVPEGGPTETVFDPAYTYRDKDGDKWTHNGNGWVCNDSDQGFDAPPAEYGPYTRIEA